MPQKINKSNKLKGLKLRTITIFLIAILVALCSFFAVNIIHIRNGYKTFEQTHEKSVKYHQDAQMLREGSYYLTEAVHLYVTTGDKQYADRYFKEINVIKRRANAVEDLQRNMIITSAEHPLLIAWNKSEQLKKIEICAIRLVAEAIAEEQGLDKDAYLSTYDQDVVDYMLTAKQMALNPAEKRSTAIAIVFDDNYLEFRNNIDSSIQEFVDSTYEATEKTKDKAIQSIKASLIQQAIFIILILAITVIYSICISRLVLKPLKIYMKCVREGRCFELLGAYEFKHLAITYNNIFELQHENEKMLRQNAEHDPLTGLLNRGAYNRISAQYIDHEINIATLIIDIDDFKTVNDTYGHDVGDEVIRSVGQLLLINFRPCDIIARIGGDEFIVIMLDITIESAENITTRISSFNDALQNPASDLPKTSLSVGVAFSEYGYSDEVFKRADIALYHTKQNGKGGSSYNKDVVRKPEDIGQSDSHKKAKK